MTLETAFTMDTSSIKYGPGVTREIGHDMKQFGAGREKISEFFRACSERPRQWLNCRAANESLSASVRWDFSGVGSKGQDWLGEE